MLAIDVNTFFGTLPSQTTDYGLPRLASLMESHGIAAALTLSLRGAVDDHVAGNAETLAAVRANPRLVPVATINPLRGLGLEDDLALIKAGGFRALRVYPGEWYQDWSPDSLAFRRVLERLAALRLPIIASGTTRATVAPLARAAAEFDLPLIFVATYYGSESEVVEAAKRYPRVFLDTARLATPDAVGTLVREIGLDRVLYGSGMPSFAPQAGMNAVFQADLSPEQRGQILYGNAARLFRLEREQVSPQREVAKFRGYDGPKIDVHAHLHLGSWSFPINAAGPEVALEYCRRYNLERAIASSLLGIMYDLEAGNRELKTIVDAHPEFRGYVLTNPNFLERSCAELDRYYRFDNFVGAKIHCHYSAQPTAGKPIRELVTEIAKRGRPLKIHNVGSGWAEAIHEMALAHPDLPIIIAHGGQLGSGATLADTPNVYFEFCGSAPTTDIIRDALAAVGPERLLFGTDQDLFDPGFILGRYHDAGLTPEQEELVMYANAKRLFDL